MTGNTLSCVKGTATLQRPKFGPGMLLRADDLDSLTTYTRELNRLMFRSLFGCGVVCGLCVKAEMDNCGDLKITVGGGLAIGCGGDPIYVPKDQSFTVGDCEDDPPDGPLWVLLCATSKCCAPRTASCGCDDDTPSSTPTRVRDCYEIRVVRKPPKCVCGCQLADGAGTARVVPDKCLCGPTDGCYADHYAGKCACCDDCTDDGSCDCSCVLLAMLTEEGGNWKADLGVRRFVRPILMRDPQCKPARAAGLEEIEEEVVEEIVEDIPDVDRIERERARTAKRGRVKKRGAGA
jgi:hypothetical protein